MHNLQENSNSQRQDTHTVEDMEDKIKMEITKYRQEQSDLVVDMKKGMKHQFTELNTKMDQQIDKMHDEICVVKQEITEYKSAVYTALSTNIDEMKCEISSLTKKIVESEEQHTSLLEIQQKQLQDKTLSFQDPLIQSSTDISKTVKNVKPVQYGESKVEKTVDSSNQTNEFRPTLDIIDQWSKDHIPARQKSPMTRHASTPNTMKTVNKMPAFSADLSNIDQSGYQRGGISIPYANFDQTGYQRGPGVPYPNFGDGGRSKRKSKTDLNRSGKTGKEDQSKNKNYNESSSEFESQEKFAARKSRRKSRKRRDSSSSTSTTTESDSRSSSRDRSRSPQLPKMATFSGKTSDSWESFIYQFERVAKRRKWNNRKKINRLLDCLREVALEYARKINKDDDYSELKKALKHRFSKKEMPTIVRRQLHYVKQDSNESLEDFSQRVYFMVMDGYEKCEQDVIDKISVEHFLKGCIDKEAAKIALEKNPKTLTKAIKYVQGSMANQKLLYGSKPNTNYTYSQRVVTFSDSESDKRCEGPQISKIEQELKGIKSMMESLQEARSHSPKAEFRAASPNKQYYDTQSAMGRYRSPPPPPNMNRNGSPLYARPFSPNRNTNPYIAPQRRFPQGEGQRGYTPPRDECRNDTRGSTPPRGNDYGNRFDQRGRNYQRRSDYYNQNYQRGSTPHNENWQPRPFYRQYVDNYREEYAPGVQNTENYRQNQASRYPVRNFNNQRGQSPEKQASPNNKSFGQLRNIDKQTSPLKGNGSN